MKQPRQLRGTKTWLHKLRYALLPARVAAVAAILACAGGQPDSGDGAPSSPITAVFENCSVITMSDELVLADQSVAVAGEKIHSLGPSESFRVPAEAQRIPCKGRFLLPGLADMHTHVGDPSELYSHLIHGVTTIANLGGDHVDLFTDTRTSILDLREAVESGARPGPHIFTSGTALDGDPATGPFQLALPSVEEAQRAVTEQHRAGYDFIKVYDGLDAETLGAIAEQARVEGMPIFGHIPEAVGTEATLAAGLDVIAHAEELYPAYEGGGDLLEISRRLASQIAGSGIWVIPNTAFVRHLPMQIDDLEAELARPQVRYLAPAVRVWWQPRYNYYVHRDDPQTFADRMRERHRWLLVLVGELEAAQVPMMMGTDASIPTALPGAAVLEELLDLREAGLSNFEALRTATANPGRFIQEHVPGELGFGTLAPGSSADLILVDGNPLADLRRLSEIQGAMARGRWYHREALEAMRAEATAAFVDATN